MHMFIGTETPLTKTIFTIILCSSQNLSFFHFFIVVLELSSLLSLRECWNSVLNCCHLKSIFATHRTVMHELFMLSFAFSFSSSFRLHFSSSFILFFFFSVFFLYFRFPVFISFSSDFVFFSILSWLVVRDFFLICVFFFFCFSAVC